MSDEPTTLPELMKPSEVALLFRVNPKTVSRWARSGKITAVKTMGGHRRFRRTEIEGVLARAEETCEETTAERFANA